MKHYLAIFTTILLFSTVEVASKLLHGDIDVMFAETGTDTAEGAWHVLIVNQYKIAPNVCFQGSVVETYEPGLLLAEKGAGSQGFLSGASHPDGDKI